MQMTVLEMVQAVLQSIEADPVNELDETPEAVSVKHIVRDAYLDMATQSDQPWLRAKGTLTGLGDTDQPTTMEIPSDVKRLLWVRYNNRPVHWRDPLSFQKLLDGRIIAADSITTVDGYFNDRAPQWWTTFDDQFIVFDAYDSDEEATLQTSNSMIWAEYTPVWTDDDGDFIPLLPEHLFPALLSEAKADAWQILKQTTNPREERRAKRGVNRTQGQGRERVRAADTKTNQGVNFGRK